MRFPFGWAMSLQTTEKLQKTDRFADIRWKGVPFFSNFNFLGYVARYGLLSSMREWFENCATRNRRLLEYGDISFSIWNKFGVLWSKMHRKWTTPNGVWKVLAGWSISRVFSHKITPVFSREEDLLAFANRKFWDTGLLHQASRDCEDFQKLWIPAECSPNGWETTSASTSTT